jgi:hypothetical protein
MEPTRAARIRDFAVATIILMAVGVFFVMAAIKAGVIGNHSSFFSQRAPEVSNDDDTPAPADIKRYVAVYRAMQHDHGLTVEQACSQQGLTVSAFRDIERKVERNDHVRNRVREQLQAKNPAPKNPPPADANSTSP